MITIHFSIIETFPNAIIQRRGLISETFIDHGVKTFHEACYYVNCLPYGQNGSTDNAVILFEDGVGTRIRGRPDVSPLSKSVRQIPSLLKLAWTACLRF
jgi:hypothetical protein